MKILEKAFEDYVSDNPNTLWKIKAQSFFNPNLDKYKKVVAKWAASETGQKYLAKNSSKYFQYIIQEELNEVTDAWAFEMKMEMVTDELLKDEPDKEKLRAFLLNK